MKKKNNNIIINIAVVTSMLCIACYLMCNVIERTWNNVTDKKPKIADESKQTMMRIKGIDEGFYYLVCDTSTNIVYIINRPYGISVYMNKDGVPARCTEFKEYKNDSNGN